NDDDKVNPIDPGGLASSFRAYAKFMSDNAVALESARSGESVIVDAERDGEYLLEGGEMLYSVYAEYAEGGTPIRYVPNQEVADIIHEKDLEQQSSERIHNALRPHLQILRDVLTPRVLEFGYEPELVEALVALEEAEVHWASTLQLIRDDWGLGDEVGWLSAAELLRACAALVDCANVDGRK